MGSTLIFRGPNYNQPKSGPKEAVQLPHVMFDEGMPAYVYVDWEGRLAWSEFNPPARLLRGGSGPTEEDRAAKKKAPKKGKASAKG